MNTNFTLDVNIHLPAAVLDLLERLSTGQAMSGPAVQAAPVPAPAGGAPHDRHRGRDAERCAGDRRRHLAADLRQR